MGGNPPFCALLSSFCVYEVRDLDLLCDYRLDQYLLPDLLGSCYDLCVDVGADLHVRSCSFGGVGGRRSLRPAAAVEFSDHTGKTENRFHGRFKMSLFLNKYFKFFDPSVSLKKVVGVCVTQNGVLCVL